MSVETIWPWPTQPPPPTRIEVSDFVSVAIAYAEDAAQGKPQFNKWVRLAAKRFLKDLKRAQQPNCLFRWSAKKANHACWWIEQLPHVEGTWDKGQFIVLEPAQVFFLCQIFGFRRASGARRYQTAVYAVARKNAKSTLAAGILLYCLCEENELGPQVISAATTAKQARIVWEVAKKMVDKLPELQEAYNLETFANSIVSYDVGGNFRPINSKASTQDGLNPSALCFDELHAHKTRDLYDVLRSASGARRNPLFLYCTTEGHETAGPWPEVRKFLFDVLQGTVEADHFLGVYYGIDDEDDEFDESKWVKANPLLGVSVTLDTLRQEATEAKHQPGQMAEFKTKRLNRPSAVIKGWIDIIAWNRCNKEFDLKAMEKLQCWGAFDLASTGDMNAWRLVWRDADMWYTWGRSWVPADAVQQRTTRGSVRYEPWVQSGHLKVTEGNVADYNIIESEIKADFERFNPAQIAYDPWNAQQMVNNLLEHKLPLIMFKQGPQSYHPAMQELERIYLAGKLCHSGDPVLKWHASNIVARRDVNSNMAPHKEKSAGKIDQMVALLMAIGIALGNEDRREFRLMVF
jgi:phage terminase large subunit-like protein